MRTIRDENWRQFALGWFPLLGILVPPIDAALNALVAALRPGYNPLQDYVSELAATGSPYGRILSAWWATFPLEFIPFALAVYAGTRNDRWARITPILLVVFAICIGLCGVFRCDPGCVGETFSAKAHLTVSALSSLALFPCPFFFWLSTRHDPRWRVPRRFSLVMQIVGFGVAILLGLAFLDYVPWAGLAERGFWVVYYLWTFAIAVKLFRLGKSERAALRRAAVS